MLAWHCVVSKPQQEFRAALELSNQEFQVYLPLLGDKPMFPRYLFTRFDREKDAWGCIKNTRGCVDLLKSGHLPALVPQHAMDAIMAYRAPEKPQDFQEQFAPGQPIKIIQGPFQGLQGLFQKDANKRISCLVEIMGRRIELPKDSIRAA